MRSSGRTLSSLTAKRTSFSDHQPLATFLPLSPLQFIAQHIEEGPPDAHEFHLVAGALAEYAVSLLHRKANLSVDAEECLLFARLNSQLDL